MDIIQSIESELVNGWGVGLISTITPGVVRIQLVGVSEEDEARHCVEARTFEEAKQSAIEFTKQNPYIVYEQVWWKEMQSYQGDEPDIECPKCMKRLQWSDDDDYTPAAEGVSFKCERCGTSSIWDLDSEIPILVRKS